MALDRSRPDRPSPPRLLVPGLLSALLLLLPVAPARPRDDAPTPAPSPSRPDLTDPIVCLNVRGFRDLDPRDEPELSRDEKLQIYYEPFNYLIVRGDAPKAGAGDGPQGGTYHAHLTQDIRIRRVGSDRVLRSESSIIDYVPESRDPPTSTYMLTTISLKEIPPGSYEIDLVLHDELADGRPKAVRTVPFRVVSPPAAPPDGR